MPNNEDLYRECAETYDRASVECQWHGPAVLFGMMYPQIRAGETLLDLGIGTGLGALLFHKAGLEVIGIDSSPAMINRCKDRGLPWLIHLHDLTRTPWPLEDNSIDHVVSTGVTHFVRNLRAVISETSRVMKAGGLFGFDFYEYDEAESGKYRQLENGIWETYNSEYDQHLYRHSSEHVLGILSEIGFEKTHDTEFLASREPKKYFRAIVSKL